MPAFFDLPLDLPHAYKVATRIQRFLDARVANGADCSPDLLRTAEEMTEVLWPCAANEENPPEPEASELRDRAAVLGRALVDQIEAAGLAHDRLGQHVRNFFECLALGEEGAAISLRAGEDPCSIQRPG